MKYFVRVCIVLLIAARIVFGFSYYYREKKNSENIVLTTQLITTKPNETTTSAEKVIYDDNGFRLTIYKDKGYAEYNNVKKEIGGFEWALSQSSIDFYYGDFILKPQGGAIIMIKKKSFSFCMLRRVMN